MVHLWLDSDHSKPETGIDGEGECWSPKQNVVAVKHKLLTDGQVLVRARKVVTLAAALAAAFLAGYIPRRAETRIAQQQIAMLRQRVETVELCNRLAIASYEAHRGNYTTASLRSAEFFNAARAIVENTPDDMLKEKVGELIASQDEIIFQLAAADPQVKDKLADAYAELFNFIYAKPVT